MPLKCVVKKRSIKMSIVNAYGDYAYTRVLSQDMIKVHTILKRISTSSYTTGILLDNSIVFPISNFSSYGKLSLKLDKYIIERAEDTKATSEEISYLIEYARNYQYVTYLKEYVFKCVALIKKIYGLNGSNNLMLLKGIMNNTMGSIIFSWSITNEDYYIKEVKELTSMLSKDELALLEEGKEQLQGLYEKHLRNWIIGLQITGRT
jgi:hypothetical protein